MLRASQIRALAGAIDTQRGNTVFNWVIPVALVLWAVKQSGAAGEADAAPVQKVA
jgi:hypothetical protein